MAQYCKEKLLTDAMYNVVRIKRVNKIKNETEAETVKLNLMTKIENIRNDCEA